MSFPDIDFHFDTQDQKIVKVKSENEEQIFHGTWYRGENTNFIPSKRMLRESKSFENYVLKGYEPDKPFIEKNTVITTFGSCFAENISRHLLDKGYNILGKKLHLNSHIVRFGEGIVNTFAIREQLEWALENKNLEQGLWFGKNKEIAIPDENVRFNTETLLKKTNVLIITIGLSEIWYDKQSNRAFWRAIPSDKFDETRHGFRLSTVQENYENLKRVVELRDLYIPNTRIIFTLSPIPLMATFRDIGCISANTISKSVLRIALDMLMNEKQKGIHYFPSYELFKEVYDRPFKTDNRHPKDKLILKTMELFESVYCNNEKMDI